MFILNKQSTLEALEKALMIEEVKRKMTGIETAVNEKGEEKALVGNEKNGQVGRERQFNDECFYCHKKEHKKMNCRTKKTDEKKNFSKEEHKPGQALGLVAQEKSDNPDQVWILDFEASSHMTMKRTAFHTYIALNKPTIIIIEDETTLKTESVGSVFL
jgi:hypothetical protein